MERWNWFSHENVNKKYLILIIAFELLKLPFSSSQRPRPVISLNFWIKFNKFVNLNWLINYWIKF